MNSVLTFLHGISLWFLSFFDRRYRLVITEGRYPARLKKKRLYVLTEDDEAWEAKLICPCGCGEVLDLNLLEDQNPTWKAWADESGAANLHPSVWRKVGCKSHFILREGTIRWC